jgi:hypothetical protein
MRRNLVLTAFAVLLAITLGYATVMAGNGNGNGNPQPGYPKDTLIFHIQKEQGPTFNHECNGGHSVHIGAEEDGEGNLHPLPTTIEITMKDWVQIDNDGDGQADEDPAGDANGDGCPGVCGVDDDGDGLIDEDSTECGADGLDADGIACIYQDDLDADDDEDGSVDEDPVEPNSNTFATDCDSRGVDDDEVGFQIGDKDPDKGQISAQTWWLRLTGPPRQELHAETSGKHAIDCTLVDNPDGIIGNEDDVITCNSEIIALDHINVMESGGDCVQSYKRGGKEAKGGGKTSFCDITDTFLVDYDNDNDGKIDEDDTIGLDGLDTDGDGSIDEDGPDGVPIFSTTCWVSYGLGTDEDPDENTDGIDNDNDGFIDEGDEAIDNDGDGLQGEDPAGDANSDGCPGICGVDDDGDGLIDEGPVNDDDEDETGEYCPLGTSIWEVDQQTGNPLIQVFVIHDEMDVSIKQTKGVKDHNSGPPFDS